jgi:hypothetical protein
MVIVIEINMSERPSKNFINFLLDLFGSLVDSILILLMSLAISTKVRRSKDGACYAIFLKMSNDELFKEFETPFISLYKDRRKIKQFNNNKEYFTVGVNKISKINDRNTRYKAELLYQLIESDCTTTNREDFCYPKLFK